MIGPLLLAVALGLAMAGFVHLYGRFLGDADSYESWRCE